MAQQQISRPNSRRTIASEQKGMQHTALVPMEEFQHQEHVHSPEEGLIQVTLQDQDQLIEW